jgi:hypothetical protein
MNTLSVLGNHSLAVSLDSIDRSSRCQTHLICFLFGAPSPEGFNIGHSEAAPAEQRRDNDRLHADRLSDLRSLTLQELLAQLTEHFLSVSISA